MTQLTIHTALSNAALQLKPSLPEPETAAFEVQLLLQHLLKVNRAWLIAHQHDALQANIHAAFEALVERRIAGEPIAYILGEREFLA